MSVYPTPVKMVAHVRMESTRTCVFASRVILASTAKHHVSILEILRRHYSLTMVPFLLKITDLATCKYIVLLLPNLFVCQFELY